MCECHSSHPSHLRAVQRCSDSLVSEDVIEVESTAPESPRDVCYEIVTDDVQGEASHPGHDAGVVADAAAILVAGDVADIVVAVLDAPMAPNDVGPCAGAQSVGGGDVIGNLAALIPQAGGRTAQPGVAGDADDGLDEGCPLGLGQGLADREDFDGAMLLSGPAFVLRRGSVGGGVRGGNGADSVRQPGLVVFQLDQQMVARGQGGGECFFGRAWRQG